MSGYTTREQQDAHDLLPEDEKSVLYTHHWNTAHKIERSMSWPKTIEIAGKKILAMPLETMALTREQQKKFEEAGGLMNPASKVATADKNQDKMMYWAESFETLQSEIDGTLYKGFDLFKKTYEAFPDIAEMTKDEATEAGLYPIIHYRNFAARKWMAEMNGGHLATLDKDYNGELSDIYKAAEGKTNLEKLAAMGQAPLGWRSAYGAKVFLLGNWALLGSGSLYGDGDVRSLNARRDKAGAGSGWCCQRDAVSSVVVLDK
jgi:hypothetical protein